MSTHTLESWRRCLIADGYAARTVSARLKVVDVVARQAGVDPAELRRDHVIDYLAARDYAIWTRRTYLQHLIAWADWIGHPEITAGIRRPPVPLSQPDPLPEVELARLLVHVAPDPRLRAWVTLGAYAGLRTAEVARLRSEQIRRDELRILGKGGRTDTLPIPPVLAVALQPWADVDGPLWSIYPARLSHTVHLSAGEIGIRMHFHQLRHRYGTAVYRRTHDLLLTQRLMRHNSPQTTAGYAALADEDARQAVADLPGATPDNPLKETTLDTLFNLPDQPLQPVPEPTYDLAPGNGWYFAQCVQQERNSGLRGWKLYVCTVGLVSEWPERLWSRQGVRPPTIKQRLDALTELGYEPVEDTWSWDEATELLSDAPKLFASIKVRPLQVPAQTAAEERTSA